MTYAQALHDAQLMSHALNRRVAILYNGTHLGYDWKSERKESGFDVPQGWTIDSIVNQGQLETVG